MIVWGSVEYVECWLESPESQYPWEERNAGGYWPTQPKEESAGLCCPSMDQIDPFPHLESLLFFIWEPHLDGFSDYFWLCAQGTLLVGLRVWITICATWDRSRMAACKATPLLSVLSLQPANDLALCQAAFSDWVIDPLSGTGQQNFFYMRRHIFSGEATVSRL